MKYLKHIRQFFKMTFLFFIILLLGGRIGGYTPKEWNPIPWDDLFTNYAVRLLIVSFAFSIMHLLMECNKAKRKSSSPSVDTHNKSPKNKTEPSLADEVLAELDADIAKNGPLKESWLNKILRKFEEWIEK